LTAGRPPRILIQTVHKNQPPPPLRAEGEYGMELCRPEPGMEAAFMAFQEDWAAHGEPITPFSARLQGRSYAAWLEDTLRMETQAPDNWVTAHTYFWMDPQGTVIGAVNLRHTLNEHLLRCGGHIGYGVRPGFRRQGHAAAMLAATLPYARALGITRALVTCDKSNIASARTIRKCGGVLENEIVDDGIIKQRYWITL